MIAWDLIACVTGSPRDRDQYDQLLPEEIAACLFTLVILEIRADWPAWAELSGVRIWKHATWPCPKCNMSASQIACLRHLGLIKPASVPWDPYTHQHYMEDIRRQSIESCISYSPI